MTLREWAAGEAGVNPDEIQHINAVAMMGYMMLTLDFLLRQPVHVRCEVDQYLELTA